jgi:hypothetical protein
MTHISQGLLAIACLLVAFSAMLAIFHPQYDDTLLQRLGLSITASAATVTALQLYQHAPADRAVIATLAGATLYGLASARKACRRLRAPK